MKICHSVQLRNIFLPRLISPTMVKFLYYTPAGARRPRQARHIHLNSYHGKLANRREKSHFMFVVTVETPRPGRQAGKAHPFTLLPWKPSDAVRHGTLIYVVIVEIPRPWQARHIHLQRLPWKNSDP